MKTKILFLLVALITLSLLAGCCLPGTGSSSVVLLPASTDTTDPVDPVEPLSPLDIPDSTSITREVVALNLTVTSIDVKLASSKKNGSAWYTVYLPEKKINLLGLQDEITASLAENCIPKGHYNMIRIKTNLSNTIKFSDEAVIYDLKVPSGTSSGIKISYDFDIDDGTCSEIKLDFDALELVHSIEDELGDIYYQLNPEIDLIE